MKLLLDACMPVEWAGFLRRNGHECVAWLEQKTRLDGLLGGGALITIETERFRTRILPLSPD